MMVVMYKERKTIKKIKKINILIKLYKINNLMWTVLKSEYMYVQVRFLRLFCKNL